MLHYTLYFYINYIITQLIQSLYLIFLVSNFAEGRDKAYNLGVWITWLPVSDTMKRTIWPLSITVMDYDFKSPLGNNSLFICSLKTPSEDFIYYVIQASENCALKVCYLHLLSKEEFPVKENHTNICPLSFFGPRKH